MDYIKIRKYTKFQFSNPEFLATPTPLLASENQKILLEMQDEFAEILKFIVNILLISCKLCRGIVCFQIFLFVQDFFFLRSRDIVNCFFIHVFTKQIFKLRPDLSVDIFRKNNKILGQEGIHP